MFHQSAKNDVANLGGLAAVRENGILYFIFSGVAGPFFFNDTATTEIYTLSLHDAFRSRGSVSNGALTQTSNIYRQESRGSIARLGTLAVYNGGTAWTDYNVTLSLQSQDDDVVGPCRPSI